jgi:hypothetical protein
MIRQNVGVDFGSGQTTSSSTPFPDHMDAANQQTLQQQQPATHVLASPDANNNNQATLHGRKKKARVLEKAYQRLRQLMDL